MSDSSNLVIDGLGKRYWIRRATETTPGPVSRTDRLRSFFSIPLAQELLNSKELWALRDVSLEVQSGTVLGIVGPNGAGKTTLLKILARVISPTTGRVHGRGRVVSLLEMGAGFDDEASARENIYMNAALNGIPRDVVARRFNEIIEFAELQELVDSPVQFYSSGQYLRLAFSVAINMEPSILLADEILAVGDTSFQERCLHKVHELARSTGLTVLFVSHDMEAITRICDRVIWLKDGRLHRDGQPDEVVTEYQNAVWETLAATTPTEDFKGSSHAGKYGEITEVALLSSDGRPIGAPPRAEDAYIRVRFRTHRAKTRARCSIELHSKGVLVFRSTQPELEQVFPDRNYQALVRIPANLLADTSYTVGVGVTLIRGEGEEHALVMNRALSFIVYGDQELGPLRNSQRRSGASLQRKGVIAPDLEWTVRQEEASVVRA
ncbi:MAG TPA: polysaccharide ABC transporter ATP-binding protein [Vicinamibacterales bacterium]|jgi:lipopolysaccharide transport system ATP-binding protein|nr:polysaccharide ABC transporter ATP-binding protein [Vicinamibacterales bacterium]